MLNKILTIFLSIFIVSTVFEINYDSNIFESANAQVVSDDVLKTTGIPGTTTQTEEVNHCGSIKCGIGTKTITIAVPALNLGVTDVYSEISGVETLIGTINGYGQITNIPENTLIRILVPSQSFDRLLQTPASSTTQYSFSCNTSTCDFSGITSPTTIIPVCNSLQLAEGYTVSGNICVAPPAPICTTQQLSQGYKAVSGVCVAPPPPVCTSTQLSQGYTISGNTCVGPPSPKFTAQICPVYLSQTMVMIGIDATGTIICQSLINPNINSTNVPQAIFPCYPLSIFKC